MGVVSARPGASNFFRRFLIPVLVAVLSAGPNLAIAANPKSNRSCAEELEDNALVGGFLPTEKVAAAVATEIKADCSTVKCNYAKLKAAAERGIRKALGDKTTDVLFKEHKLKDFRIYGLFIGAILTYAGTLTYVQHGLNPILGSFITGCLTVAPFIIMALGSSIVSKITAATSQLGWNNGAPVYRDQVDKETQILLESLNRMSHQNLSLLAQGGRSTLLGALRELKADFSSIMQATLIQPEITLKIAPGLIALEAFSLRKLYPKVDFSDPEFARWPKRIFSNHFIDESNYKSFVKTVIEILSADDPEGFADPRTRQRYLAMITAWIEPEKHIATTAQPKT